MTIYDQIREINVKIRDLEKISFVSNEISALLASRIDLLVIAQTDLIDNFKEHFGSLKWNLKLGRISTISCTDIPQSLHDNLSVMGSMEFQRIGANVTLNVSGLNVACLFIKGDKNITIHSHPLDSDYDKLKTLFDFIVKYNLSCNCSGLNVLIDNYKNIIKLSTDFLKDNS